MSKPAIETVILRADADAATGTGHVMRCLALAQAWKREGGSVVFVSACRNIDILQRAQDVAGEFVGIEATYPAPGDAAQTCRVLDGHADSALVLDGYGFDGAYQEAVKEASARLVVIDDYVHAERYCADIVLNQNLGAERLTYPCPPETRMLLGPEYVLLRDEYLRWQDWRRDTPAVAKRVLVTLGGSDPSNTTMKVIRALKRLNVPDVEAMVVVGAANPHRAALAGEIEDGATGVRLCEDVADMAELMAWADVAVSAGGTTCWELAFMGLPNAIIVLADNQRGVACGLKERGVSALLGEAGDVTEAGIAEGLEELMRAWKQRERMSVRGRELVDGNGAGRVVAAIREHGR